MASVPTPRPASTLLLLATYLGTLIGGIVLLYVLVYIVEEFFKTTFPDNNAMGLILIAVSAMNVGTFWYNREQAAPSSGRKWKLAFLLTILTVALQVGMIYMLASLAGEWNSLLREFAGEDKALIIGVFAFLGLLEFLMIRASLWSGVRNGIKQAERKAAKAAR